MRQMRSLEQIHSDIDEAERRRIDRETLRLTLVALIIGGVLGLGLVLYGMGG